MTDLESIYVRAMNTEGKWGSYNLQEILDGGFGGQIASWFFQKVGEVVGYQEGAMVTEEHAKAMVNLLERLGSTIYRIKEE